MQSRPYRKSRYLLFLFTLTLGFLNTSTVLGQLSWYQKKVVVNAGKDDKSATRKFKFVNNGNYPVTIKSVIPSCGCTAATLEKKEYLPGEEGEITVAFDFGSRTGVQLKQVTVKTDDEKNPSAILSMRVNIPQIVQLEPRHLLWQANESSMSKVLNVIVVDENPVEVSKVVFRPVKKYNEKETFKENQQDYLAEFKADLKVIEDGRMYKVVVTPPTVPDNINQSFHAKLVITTEASSDNMTRNFSVPIVIFSKQDYYGSIPTQRSSGEQSAKSKLDNNVRPNEEKDSSNN